MKKILGLFGLIILFIQCGRTTSKDSSKIIESKVDTVNIDKKIINDTLFLEKCYNKGHYGSVHQKTVKMSDGTNFFVEQAFIVDSTRLLQFDTIIENSKTITKRHCITYDGYTDFKVFLEDKTLIFKKTFKPLERRIQKGAIYELYQDFFFANYYNLEYFNSHNNSIIISSFGAMEYCVCDTLGNLKHVGFLPPLSSNIHDLIDSLNIYITCAEIFDIENSKVFPFSNLSSRTLLRYYVLDKNIYLIFEGNDFKNEMNDLYVLSQDLKVQKKSRIKILDSRNEIIEGFCGGNKIAIFSNLTDSLLIIENKNPFNTDWILVDSIKQLDNSFKYHDELYFNCSSPLRNMTLYVDTLKNEFRKDVHERDGD